MAVSPSHQFGQIIGDVLEDAVRPLLVKFARKHRLYLDQKGPRPCRTGKKCSWTDSKGNVHDLDFVFERGGTPNRRGPPIAFIETAWRRYTKHSRNKAQEIQGAIEPLAEKYEHHGPFKGAVLGGVFTDGAINQLKSLGFTVLFIPYEAFIEAFKRVGIDALFTEDSPDAEFKTKVERWDKLPASGKAEVASALLEISHSDVENFMASLEASIARRVERILVLPLHGVYLQLTTVEDAVRAIESYEESVAPAQFERYEVQIQFSNTNEITGKFNDKASAIHFLRMYQPFTKVSSPKK